MPTVFDSRAWLPAPTMANWCSSCMDFRNSRMPGAPSSARGIVGYHAIAVDQRGYSPGARPSAVEDYTVDKLSSDALGFADFFGAQRFHLVGHDWGGAVAWVTAAHGPERLTTLTVLSTPHPDALSAALQSDPDQQKRSAYFQLFRARDHAAERALLADDAKLLRGAYMGKVPVADVDANVRRFEGDGTLTAALN